MSIVNIPALKQNQCQLWYTGQSASANGSKTVTANGDVTQILPFPGAGIAIFNGSSDYLYINDVTDFALNGLKFTITILVYPKSITGNTYIMGQVPFDGVATNTAWGILLASGVPRFYWRNTAGTPTGYSSTTGALTINTWNILTFRSDGTSIFIDVNNVSGGSATLGGINTSTLPFAIGRAGEFPYYFNGYLSELSFRVGVNDTSIKSFVMAQNTSDTKLLLHFQANSTTFTDYSSNPKTITAYGGAKQLTGPCGSGVAYLDGNGDYLTVSASADWVQSTTMQIGGWVYLNAYPTSGNYISLFNSRVDGNNASMLRIVNTSEVYSISFERVHGGSTVVNIFSNITLSLNVWYPFLITSDGATIKLYFNNILVASVTSLYYLCVINNNILYIGKWAGGDSGYLNGYLSEYFIKSGGTLLSSVPTQPFKPDPYIKLLLHFDGVGNAFYNASDAPGDNGFPILPYGVTVTPNGTFTVQKLKNGINCYKFDGSTNYISLSDNDAWNFGSGDFTISSWILTTSLTNSNALYGQNSSDQSSGSTFSNISNAGKFRFNYFNGGSAITVSSNATLVTSTFYFVTVVRSGSNLYIYINSILDSTFVISGTIVNTSTSFCIGRSGDTTLYYMIGNIKDLMIFKKALTQDQIGSIMAETYIY